MSPCTKSFPLFFSAQSVCRIELLKGFNCRAWGYDSRVATHIYYVLRSQAGTGFVAIALKVALRGEKKTNKRSASWEEFQKPAPLFQNQEKFH